MTDVVVLERDKLTSGTTWHAAGEIVSAILGSEWERELCTCGRNLIAVLEEETGQVTGFRQVGYIQPADTHERFEELRRGAAFMRRFGINDDYTNTPIEAALGFAIKLDKQGGFIGKDALAKLKAAGVSKRRMLQFLLHDPETLLHGNETI